MNARIASMTLGLALVAGAQTGGTPEKPAPVQDPATETFWKIEVSGIAGWSAPSTAVRVRSVIEDVRGVQNLEFDTLGVGYFDASNDKFEPTVEMFQQALDEKKVRNIQVRSVQKVELPKAIGRVELSVQGLGWMSTCQKARAALISQPGIVRIHPYGHNGKIVVYLANKEAYDQEAWSAALELQELQLRKAKVKR